MAVSFTRSINQDLISLWAFNFKGYFVWNSVGAYFTEVSDPQTQIYY